jgi:hypothetical protein
MAELEHLKCLCEKCRSPIAFPAHGIGTTVKCPHCDQDTILCAAVVGGVEPSPEKDDTFLTGTGQNSVPENLLSREASPESGAPEQDIYLPQSEPNDRRRWLATLGIVLLAGVAAMVFGFRTKQAGSNSSENRDSERATNRAVASIEISDSTKADGAPLQVSPAKSITDLKVSPITIEKAKGSSLVYAVGRLKNDSDHQRFGLNVELELTDARGMKLGVARDYRNVLEPRQEWRFRALVLHPMAVSAKVASIREEE